jgi:Lrp/AsnC family leucine-responsive transcriptional regulator
MQNKSLSPIDGLPSLDRIDLKILRALQDDGRLANLKLAEAIGLSPTAVLARVQRLTRDGYILGYEARLNPLKLGAGMLVFVEVLLDRTTPNVFDQFKAAVQAQPAIMECHMVAGGFDYLLKTRSADMNDYRQFAGRAVAATGGARDADLRGDGGGQELDAPAPAVTPDGARLVYSWRCEDNDSTSSGRRATRCPTRAPS